jgi:uncharacterized cupredoxin-like copper-binding protein
VADIANAEGGWSMRRRPTRFRCAARAAAVVAALGVVLSMPHSGRSAPTAVRLVAKEFLFAPSDVMAQQGQISFVVTNQGAIEHNVVVETGGTKAMEIAILEPGETRRIDASLPPGTYVIYCNLPGHREAGMVATLRVNP